MFCLRTSKGLSVGEFDDTEIHCIFDSDFTCILVVLLSFCCVIALFFFVFRFLL